MILSKIRFVRSPIVVLLYCVRVKWVISGSVNLKQESKNQKRRTNKKRKRKLTPLHNLM